MGRAALVTPPYLVLLRAGFCLPPALPRARCALTAPFHPYPSTRATACAAGSLRAVYFLCHFPSGHPDRALPGALPCGVRTFLPSRRSARVRALAPETAVVWLDCGGIVDSPQDSLRPGGCCTARASCTGYCAACRSPRPSSRCSSRSRAASATRNARSADSLNSRSVPRVESARAPPSAGAGGGAVAGSLRSGLGQVRRRRSASPAVMMISALDRVAQLADVALPAVPLQRVQRLRREPLRPEVVLAR